jgi:preprotein translocase subunit SecD
MNKKYTLLTVSIVVIFGLSGCNRNSLPKLSLDSPKEKYITTDMAMLCSRGGSQLELFVETPKGLHDVTPELLEKVRKSLAKRISDLGVEDFSIKASSRQSLTIQLPGVEDLGHGERVLGGLRQLKFGKQKAGTEPRLIVETSVQKALKSKEIELRESGKLLEISENKIALRVSAEELVKIYDQSNLTGADVKNAFPVESQDGKVWSVGIEFDEQGSNKFTDITKDLAGTGLSLGVFLDDELVSAPVIDIKFAQTGISGGKANISGQLSANEANELATKIRHGALPASIRLIESRTIEKGTSCNYQVAQSFNNSFAFEVEPGKVLNANEMQRLVASYQLSDGHYSDQLKIADLMLSQYLAAGVQINRFETLAEKTNTDLLDLVALDAILRVSKAKEFSSNTLVVGTQPSAPTTTREDTNGRNHFAGTMAETPDEETFYKAKWAALIIVLFSVIGTTVKHLSKRKNKNLM